jgi:hypothetical protein
LAASFNQVKFDVAYWHKADVLKASPDIRFEGNAYIVKSMSVPDL